jgi:hypothetical protein
MPISRTSALYSDQDSVPLRLMFAMLTSSNGRAVVVHVGDSVQHRRVRAGTKSEIVQTRARFLSQLQSDAVAHYVADGSPKWTAAQTVAVITDLAPEWLYDSATSRRRPV